MQWVRGGWAGACSLLGLDSLDSLCVGVNYALEILCFLVDLDALVPFVDVVRVLAEEHRREQLGPPGQSW